MVKCPKCGKTKNPNKKHVHPKYGVVIKTSEINVLEVRDAIKGMNVINGTYKVDSRYSDSPILIRVGVEDKKTANEVIRKLKSYGVSIDSGDIYDYHTALNFW